MKKTYISPDMLVVRIAANRALLSGSLNIDGEGGSATFYGDTNATDEAMGRDNTVSDYNLWDKAW